MSLPGYQAKIVDTLVWTTINKLELNKLNGYFNEPILHEGTMTLTIVESIDMWIKAIYSPNNKMGVIIYTNKLKQPCILGFDDTDQELLENYAHDIFIKSM